MAKAKNKNIIRDKSVAATVMIYVVVALMAFVCIYPMYFVLITSLSDPQYAEGRRQVKAETWEHPGEGAVRAVDYLMSKYEELTAKEDK